MEPSAPPTSGNPDPADRAFARYCAKGDPGDLAQTFEATAPELLRVARHLTPDAATAEDVVQATFLAAIESRARFEQGQRVRPWLCGILEHKAKEIARRERRVIDPERLPESVSEAIESSPADAAERSEMRAAVDVALGELSETYRAVLHPYLTTGKSARVIAESLRRPAGTVRTQIVRGLEQLRQALPVGLAGAFTAWILPARGLAAVQQSVVNHAQATGTAATAVVGAASTHGAAVVSGAQAGTTTSAPGAIAGVTTAKTAATTGGILLMKKLLIPALLGLIAYGAYALITPLALPPEKLASSTAQADPATVESNTPAATNPALVAAATDEPPGREAVQPSAAPSDGTTLRGRVVHEVGGVLANVRVVAWNQHHFCMQRDGDYVLTPVVETTTNAAGEFTLAGLKETWTVSAISPTTQARVRMQGRSAGRQEIDGLELVMADTVILRGQLLDADGAPVANHSVGNPIAGSSSASDRTEVPDVYKQRPDLHQTTTDADGRFAIRCIANINYRWMVKHPQHPLWQKVHRASDGPLQVQLERGTEVLGQVWLPDGTPAAGAAVSLTDSINRETTADGAGQFLFRGATLDAFSRLRVFDERAAIYLLTPVPTDAALIEVQLEPSQSIRGRVVDGDGNPVRNARIQVHGDRKFERDHSKDLPSTWEYVHKRNETRTESDGAFALNNLYSGRFEVRAYPPGEEHAFVSTSINSGTGPVTLRLDPTLLRKTALQGSVVDAATGEPIPQFKFAVYRVTEDGARGEVKPGTKGRFERVGLEPGSLYISIEAPGYARTESRPEAYGLGEHYFEFRLHRTTAATFEVTDEHGAPVDATLVFSTPDGQRIWIPSPMGSVTSMEVRKETADITVSGLPATTLIVEAIRAPLPPTRTQIDLSAPLTDPVRLVVQSLPEQIAFLCALAEFDAGWTPPADLNAQTKPALVQAYQDGTVGQLMAQATLRLETADGILVCRGTVTPLPPEPGSKERRFKTATGSIHDGQQGGSSSESGDSMINLWGIAGPMRLFVDVKGRESQELELDGTTLASPNARPIMVWVPR